MLQLWMNSQSKNYGKPLVQSPNKDIVCLVTGLGERNLSPPFRIKPHILQCHPSPSILVLNDFKYMKIM